MKTLILNGSPRLNGDTAFLLAEFKKNINHEMKELRVFDKGVNIQPCIDCRACKTRKGCVLDDDMKIVYGDNFDNVIIASPLYMSNLTPPLMALASRFQAYYCAARFIKDKFVLKPKKAGLILVGGGDGGPEQAIKLSRFVFKSLNAKISDKHMAFSLKTDDIPVAEDIAAIEKTREIAGYFNL